MSASAYFSSVLKDNLALSLKILSLQHYERQTVHTVFTLLTEGTTEHCCRNMLAQMGV